ncbi:MAG: helix-turn-helix transcriptional regulator [Candidatus Bathyarchaeota archaeon]|nr:MAG: helix-turn-helix transcriptional regulator [Candidatus Bathyarchaeota archaeon]
MKRGITETCVGFFSTLANPTRLAILEKLSNGNMNVTQLTQALKQEQSMISHNLKPLLHCRLIYSRKEGKTRIYSINRETVNELFNIVENHAEKHCLFQGNCPDAR